MRGMCSRRGCKGDVGYFRIFVLATIRLGSDFFFTQPIYDTLRFESFIKKVAHLKVPIIAAVTLLKSVGMARYIQQHVEGASIPDSIIDRLMKGTDKRQASVGIASDLIRAIRPLCHGALIIPIGWEALVPDLLDQAGLSS